MWLCAIARWVVPLLFGADSLMPGCVCVRALTLAGVPCRAVLCRFLQAMWRDLDQIEKEAAAARAAKAKLEGSTQ